MEQEDGTIYLDCTVDPSSPSSFVSHYMVIPKNNDIQVYQRKENIYLSICNLKGSECSISQNEIKYISNNFNERFMEQTRSETTIHRYNGDYSGSTWSSHLGSRFFEGNCKVGQSSVIAKRKF
jgi:hypothetical protein